MQNLVITGKGQELTAKLIAGTSTAIFTKIATSSHDYSSATLKNVTELYDIKQTALISKVSRTDTTIVEVLAKIDNTNLESGYYVKALGLYAKGSDGVEILFGISIETDNPDYMPPQSGITVSGISYRLNTKVDNSDQVTIEVNPAASPTVGQFEELEQVINTHAKTGVYGSEGAHGIRYYNDTLQVKNKEGSWIDLEEKTEMGTKFTVNPTDFTSTTVDTKPCYVAKINLTAIYARVPEIGIVPTGSNTIPTETEIEAFSKITYASVDDTTLSINLYASELSKTAFSIIVKGVS